MKRLFKAALCALEGPSDQQLMWRVKATGDHEAFARLVKRWEGPIRSLCSRLTGDPARGEELKQETFLRVFRSRQQYGPSARFSTLLWRIALNLCHDEFRREERRREFFSDTQALPTNGTDGEAREPASETSGPDTTAVRLEEGELVRRAVLALPEIYRTVIVLRHYENLKLTEIAEVLGIPDGTVNSRMAAALAQLNAALAPKLRPAASSQLPISAVMRVQKSTVL